MMMVEYGLANLAPTWTGAVVCVGTFDGVHLGHQAVIGSAVREARARNLPCVLLTFDRHPAAILAPSRRPLPLAIASTNLSLFESHGVDFALILPFDLELSQMTAEEFFQTLLITRLRARHVVVGHDFAMGHRRVGTATWIAERIETTVIPPFEVGGLRVSSSQIRLAVESGDLAMAQKMLGRPFSVSGIVVPGDQIGRTLGFPTANLSAAVETVQPRDGVYAGWADTPEGKYEAAISIGSRPSVGGERRVTEAYLLDYTGNSLYGRFVTLHFHRFLRNQERSSSLDELKQWISHDIEVIRTGS